MVARIAWKLRSPDPMLNSLEMGHTLEGVESGVGNDAELRPMFEKAFGSGRPTMAKITKAIASFERTLLSGNSPFDRYQYAGDQECARRLGQRGLAGVSRSEKGMRRVPHDRSRVRVVFGRKFHNLGVGLSPEGQLTDLGRYELTGDGKGEFRTPSLRNVAKTAPYMHDGSLKTLERSGRLLRRRWESNHILDKQIKPLTHLTQEERADLVAFLESLTGEAAK